jgi:hypothetical protein
MEEEEETLFMRSEAEPEVGLVLVASPPIEMPPTAESKLNKLLGDSILRRSRDAIRLNPLTGERRLLLSPVTTSYIQQAKLHTPCRVSF